MSVISVVIILCVFAAAFYLVWKFVPSPGVKNALLIVIGILLVIWLAIVTNLYGIVTRARIP